MSEARREFVAPKWMYGDSFVWLPRGDEGTLCCKVLVAAGDRVRIANEEHGIDCWRRLNEVLVPADDPRATTGVE